MLQICKSIFTSLFSIRIRHTAHRVKRYGHTVDIRLTDNTIIITSSTINTFTSRFRHYRSLPAPLLKPRRIASANSALIRYYLPRLKLSSSTLALARERTNYNIIIIISTWCTYPVYFTLPYFSRRRQF